MSNKLKLKKYLEVNGYKNKWLEIHTLMGRQTVSNWLTGRATPQVKHAKKIEEITGGAVPADGWAR